MGNDDVEALFDEVNDGSSGVGNQLELLLGGIAESVTAQGNNETLVCHS